MATLTPRDRRPPSPAREGEEVETTKCKHHTRFKDCNMGIARGLGAAPMGTSNNTSGEGGGGGGSGY